jgi:chaperonin GroES
MKTIQPIGDRILVKVIEPQRQTASGLYLPDTPQEGPREGIIVAIGEGSSLHERLSVNDSILYTKFGGTEVALDDGKYRLLTETDILGRIVDVEPLKQGAAKEANSVVR